MELAFLKHFIGLFLISLIFSLLSESPSQIITRQGNYYPKDFRFIEKQDLGSFNKVYEDTLNYTSFEKIVDDFDIINGCGSYDADQNSPNVSYSNDGYYLCIWMDERTGNTELDAQLFDSTDTRVGDVLKISDEYSKWNSQPLITYNRVSKEFIITWASSGFDILLQRISVTGERIGNNFTVNQRYWTNTNNPGVSTDQEGNILVSWYSDNGYFGPNGIFYRIFDKNLNAITDQLEVPYKDSGSPNSSGRNNRVASDDSGNFFVTWSSYRDNVSRIIIQQIKNTGLPVNNNIVVSDSSDLSIQYFPTMAGNGEGFFFILWSTETDLKGRIYSVNDGFVTPVFTVSDSQSTWFTYSVSSDNQDYFYVAFTGRSPNGQVITKYGSFIGKNRQLNLTGKVSYPTYVKLSDSFNNSFYCVFNGYRKNDAESMIQKFDTNFSPIGNAVKLNPDNCTSFQTDPLVKFNSSGNGIMIWTDRRDGTANLYGQIVDDYGNKTGENFIINDTSEATMITNPHLLATQDDNFVISYSGGDYWRKEIFLQKISQNGEKIGDPLKLTNDYYQNPVSFIKESDNGDLLLCWTLGSYSPYGYIQKMRSDFELIGLRKKVFNSINSGPKRIFDFAVNKNFNTIVLWADYNYSTNETDKTLKGIIFNENGAAISDTLYIDTLTDDGVYSDGICEIDSQNNIVFEWKDYNRLTKYPVNVNFQRRYNNNDQYYIYSNSYPVDDINSKMQIITFRNKKLFASWASYKNINSVFLDDNKLSMIPIRLQIIQPFNYIWGIPFNNYCADVFRDKLLLCFESVVNPDKGYDIWANIQKMNLNFEPDEDSVLISNEIEMVSLPYPNPVTSSAGLNFRLTQPLFVQITLYNILGERVLEIQNGMMEPGDYYRGFETDNLSSGIYFIQYKGLKTYTKKILVVK